VSALGVAVQFLTRLPVRDPGRDAASLARAPRCFPLVGALVGGLLWLAHVPLAAWLPPGVERTLLVGLGVALSGALHLDGLSDTVDGLVGGRDRESTLRIMQDPHAGSIGTAAVVGALLLKQSALLALPAGALGPCLLAACIVGRSALLGALLVPPARPNGFAASFAQPRTALRLGVLVAGGLVTPLALLGTSALGALLVAGLAAGGVLYLGVRRLRGVTGDVCGAAGEVAETAFLIGAAGALA